MWTEAVWNESELGTILLSCLSDMVITLSHLPESWVKCPGA